MKKRVEIQIITGAKNQKINEIAEGMFRVWVKSKPAAGAANKELIEILSSFFKIPKSDIKIITGKSFKKKVIELICPQK
jgi:hypothetical protein